MKKLFVIIFSIALLGFSYLGLTNRLYFAASMVNLSHPFMMIRVIIVTVLLFYTFISWFRLRFVRVLLFLCGLLFISLGLVSIYSPGLFGHLNNWILIGDSLSSIEVGIISIVLSTELTDRRTQYLVETYYNLRLLFTKRYINFQYAYLSVLKNITICYKTYGILW